jgi:hypothetical protein
MEPGGRASSTLAASGVLTESRQLASTLLPLDVPALTMTTAGEEYEPYSLVMVVVQQRVWLGLQVELGLGVRGALVRAQRSSSGGEGLPVVEVAALARK